MIDTILSALGLAVQAVQGAYRWCRSRPRLKVLERKRETVKIVFVSRRTGDRITLAIEKDRPLGDIIPEILKVLRLDPHGLKPSFGIFFEKGGGLDTGKTPRELGLKNGDAIIVTGNFTLG